MRTFTDNAGRTWTIAINVALVKRVRGALNLDLFKLLDEGARPLGELLADPVRLADVLFCLCKEHHRRGLWRGPGRRRHRPCRRRLRG
jgi:hypothetical protein